MTTVPEKQATPGADPLVGMVLDRYRVIEKLGEGGMGAVYAVEHVMLQKRMAMKLLRADLSSNQDLVTRFQNEAIAASRIGQENIVAVTDFGRTPDGLVYFVMEELYGKSLAQVIRAEGSLSLGRMVGIAAQVCRALQAAHQVGIVHRDLKPENIILVTREDQVDFVKVLDFGISKTTEPQPSGARLTQVGMIVGTPEYMSPEQASGKHVDARADVYSLGVVIFEMLTGRLPFHGENTLQILMKHQTQSPPTLAEAAEGISFSADLEAMVRKALAKLPEERQQSMAECLRELQRFAAAMEMSQPDLPQPQPAALPAPGTTAAIRFPSQPGWASPTTVTPASPVPSEPAPELDVNSLRPSRTGLWVALLLVLAGAGLGALALSGRFAPSPNPATAPQPGVKPASPPAIAAPGPAAQPPLPAPPPAFEPPKPPRAAASPRLQAERASHPGKTDVVTPKPTPRPTPARTPGDPYQKVEDLKAY